MKRKTVIITGGNRGIGLSITKKYIEEGYNVIVGARQEYNLKKILGDKILFIQSDVRNENNHLKLVEAAIEKTGRLDVFINNAGYSEWRPISEIDDQFLDDIISTNLKGAFWGCKAAASALKAGGSIINISSLAGKRGSLNNSAYCATKFGMNGLTQALAKELGLKEIRVNAVCPVLIKTDGLVEALNSNYSPAKNSTPEEFINNFKNSNAALPRLPSGKEVADLCLYLSSDASSAITGQCINLDCGVLPQ